MQFVQKKEAVNLMEPLIVCLAAMIAGATVFMTQSVFLEISELNRLGVMSITLEGGEAFVRSDLKTLLEGIVDNRMRFSILSNGTCISENLAAFIASTGRCNAVQVSVDGSTAKTHDACRGNGSFAKALAGIRLLKNQRVPVTVRVTLHRQNMRDLDNIAELLLEQIGLESFSTNAASYMGLCRQNTDNVQLTIEDRVQAMKDLLRLNKKYNGRIKADAGPLKEAITWRQMDQALKKKVPSMPGRGSLKGCGGVFSKLGVLSDGVIVPCILLPHIRLGRINQDDIEEIWQNHPEMTRLRNRREIPLSDFEFCAGCPYIPYCTGSCPAISYNLTGFEDHPSPDACLKRFLEAGGALPDNCE